MSGSAPAAQPARHRIPTLHRVWSDRLVGTGTTPVTDNGTVFVTASDGKKSDLYALRATCPPAPAPCAKDLLWTRQYAPGFGGLPTILSPAGAGNSDVYLGATEYEGGGYHGGLEQALNETTGGVVFSTRSGALGAPGITAAVETGGIVYTSWEVVSEGAFTDTATEALDASTGAPLFTTTVNSVPPLGRVVLPTGPAVGGGTLFVGYGSSLDAYSATGSTGCAPASSEITQPSGFTTECAALWSGATGGTITGTPAIAGGEVYVGASDGVLYAFPEAGCGGATCSPDWTATLGGTLTTSVATDATTLYVTSSKGTLAAFPVGGCHSATCAPAWSATVGGTPSAPTVGGSLVYVASTNRVLDAFTAAGYGSSSCSPAWHAHLSRPSSTAPAVGDGVVVVADARRTLSAYRTP